MNILHKPVMLQEILKYLNIKPNGLYIDCTFGGGGHSKSILKHLNAYGKLYVLDRDPKAIKLAKKINDSRITIIQDSFSNLNLHVKKYNLFNKINGVLLDLGISTDQLKDCKRGFSYKINGPLDMRMNPNIGVPLCVWLNKATKEEIEFVLKNYGELRNYKLLSRKIFFMKNKKNIQTTLDLINILNDIHYMKYKYQANKMFQAFRIQINDELYELKKILSFIIDVLSNNGILAIISFHSLENKIIKSFITKYSQYNLPDLFQKIPLIFKELQRYKNKYWIKSIIKLKPKKSEIIYNHSSRSAILRVLQKKEK